MGDANRRRLGELTRKLLEILGERPDGLRAKDALAQLASVVPMTEWESGTYANGARRFEKNVRFATVDLIKAGWMLKNKGTWTITDAGRDAVMKFSDPEAFYREACRLYDVWKRSRPAALAKDEEAPEPSPDGDGEAATREVAQTFEDSEEAAWNEVEEFLTSMNPYDLQELVADLLRAMGYHVAWVAPPGRDGGVDILAFNDPLGTRPPRVKVQVKRQQTSVSVDGLRSFMALLGEDDVGVFVNAGGFTRDAQEEARTQEKRRISLLDLEKLFDLWVEHYKKLDDAARRRMPLKPIYFLAPPE